MPVLPSLRTGLSGDRLHGLAGILNGTCNYILSRIENARIPFSEALEEAQARGYAEADASEDLDGGDARAKLAILALAGLHTWVAPESIRARTIRPVDAVDFDYAADLGCTIRQISRADLKNENLFADVGPCLVPTDSPFGRVQRNLNLVLTSGQYGGDMAFLGAGAGGDPTAVAVVSDLKFVAEGLSAGQKPRRKRKPAMSQPPPSAATLKRRGICVSSCATVPASLAKLAEILAAHHLNIDSLPAKAGLRQIIPALRDHPRTLSRLRPATRTRKNGSPRLHDPPLPVSADPAPELVTRTNESAGLMRVRGLRITLSRRLRGQTCSEINSRRDYSIPPDAMRCPFALPRPNRPKSSRR